MIRTLGEGSMMPNESGDCRHIKILSVGTPEDDFSFGTLSRVDLREMTFTRRRLTTRLSLVHRRRVILPSSERFS